MLLFSQNLTCINEKRVSEGWSCAGRGPALGSATVGVLPWGPLRSGSCPGVRYGRGSALGSATVAGLVWPDTPNS